MMRKGAALAVPTDKRVSKQFGRYRRVALLQHTAAGPPLGAFWTISDSQFGEPSSVHVSGVGIA